MFETIKTENGEEVYQALNTYRELMPRYMEEMMPAITNLQTLLLELNSKHSKKNDTPRIVAEKMKSLFAENHAQFQGLTQLFANVKAAAAALPAAIFVALDFEKFANTHLAVFETRTTLLQDAEAQLVRVIDFPTSVCHSEIECGSYSDSSLCDSSQLCDSSCSSSSDVPTPDSSGTPDEFSDCPRQKRSKVHSDSESAVSPERASLQLQVRISTQRAPPPPLPHTHTHTHTHPLGPVRQPTCSPAGIGSGAR